MLKELFWGLTDFTEAIFKIPQISKHLSAMLFDINKGSFKFVSSLKNDESVLLRLFILSNISEIVNKKNSTF